VLVIRQGTGLRLGYTMILPTIETDYGQAVRQLNILFGRVGPQLTIAINHKRETTGFRTEFFKANQLEEAARFGIERTNDKADVWVRVCPLAQSLTKGKRGTIEDSVALPALFADLDIGKGGHTPDRDTALHTLRSVMPLEPTMTISSGHGLHVYYCLHEPITDMAHAQQLADAWKETLLGGFQSAGYGLDHVFELARVLRLAGTVNYKDKTAPVPVELLEHDSNKLYCVADFEPFLYQSPQLIGCVTERTEITERTETIENTEENRDNRCNGGGVPQTLCYSDAVKKQIQEAIESTLPTSHVKRNKAVFELCRALKAIPLLHDADPIQLRDIVKQWHQAALPCIGTKPFEETWADFIYGWPKVKFPKGQEPMAMIKKKAEESTPPIIALELYDCPKTLLLVCLCRELQRASGDGPFYLACRTAGRLLFGGDHMAASRRLKVLVTDGFLALVEKGTKTKAARYRYLGNVVS